MKEFVKLAQEKEQCSGCSACYAICPKQAISMLMDEEGFYYPKIDHSQCIACKLCINVCPMKKD